MENVNTEKETTVGGRGGEAESSCPMWTPPWGWGWGGVDGDVGGGRGVGTHAKARGGRRPASHSPGATHQPHVPHNVTLPRLTQREHRKRGGAEAKEGRELGMGRGVRGKGQHTGIR